MHKLIIAGSRDFNDYSLLKSKVLEMLSDIELSEVEIVSGGARGADLLGERFAKEHGCKIKRFIPDWDGLGKRAGFVRNWEMAKYADSCACFWDGKSKGTSHMIDLAIKEGLEVKVFTF